MTQRGRREGRVGMGVFLMTIWYYVWEVWGARFGSCPTLDHNTRNTGPEVQGNQDFPAGNYRAWASQVSSWSHHQRAETSDQWQLVVFFASGSQGQRGSKGRRLPTVLP
eukprot:EG_transcript_12903